MPEPLDLPSNKYLSPVDSADKPYVLGRVPKQDGSLSQFTRHYAKFGGKEGAMDAARKERDIRLRALWGEKLKSLLQIGEKPKRKDRNPRSDSLTGKVGVNRYFDRYGKFVGFIASWSERDTDGNMEQKHAYYHSGHGPETDHEAAFTRAALTRDRMTDCPVLSDEEYLKLLNRDCMVDRDKEGKSCKPSKKPGADNGK